MMRLRLLSILLVTAFISCTSKHKFSKEEWELKEDGMVNQRKDMEEDLINNYLNTSLSYKEIIILLGVSDSRDSTNNRVSYTTFVEYEWLGIDETKVRYLDLAFDKDSILMNSQIREWNKKNE